MQMGSVEEDPCGESIVEDTCATKLITPDSPDIHDKFGEPQVLPRVGDLYQVDIPPQLTESDRLQLLKTPLYQEFSVDIGHSFLLGLPIPVMWIQNGFDRTKVEPLDVLGAVELAEKRNGPIESENNKVINTDTYSGDLKLKVEPLNFASDIRRELGGPSRCAVTGIENKPGLTFSGCNKSKLDKYSVQGYSLAPGSSSSSWSDFEQEGFLLGLYIFGKNFVQAKKFIGSKEMGDILSFYYGNFYRSDRYRRWSDCRKPRSRRCVHGQRIFSGWRQQELLSRLLPNVSEECKNTLVEVSRRFAEGKISLEEYISALKLNVGMKLLIDAVGIGKGKKDLTRIVTEPVKANQIIHTRLEIPVGKACSSLATVDIIKFLTGHFRLSKARSNDLFWEAVWPRLLAKGWHSEQPRNRGYNGSKHSLVFLIPGVKKFSRRRLVKGSQYFDSVSDVLNKVASEPSLVELDIEEHRSSSRDEDESGTKVGMDQDSHFNHQRRRFLQPRVSDTNPDLMKFTVVDTSLVQGEEPFSVRRLRSLPVDTTKVSTQRISRKNDRANFKEPGNKLKSNDIRSNDKENTNTSSASKLISDQVVSGCRVSDLKQGIPIDGSEPTIVLMACHNDNNSSKPDKNPDKIMKVQSIRINGPKQPNVPMDSPKDGDTSMPGRNPGMIKCQFSRRRKHGQSNSIAPVTKRRRLTACSREDATHSEKAICVDHKMREKELLCQMGSSDGDNTCSEVGSYCDKGFTNFSAKDSPGDTTELGSNCFSTEASHETNPPRSLIDLNLLPHVSPDFESCETSATKMENKEDHPGTIGLSFPSEANHQLEDSQVLKTPSRVSTAEQQLGTISRRQSTRNRPLTTKALEALECGFLTSKGKWRSMEPTYEENLIPKTSRRARGKVNSSTNFDNVTNVTLDSIEQQGLEEECSTDTNKVNVPQVLTGKVS
ncbi:hypothetical protein IFM89_015839 [Coptis chinensis]|uniref:SANT domain-containing protein n=1 Tax=Coptis chinensis TaxID=261450 RepID=A0A835IRK7_9MAGN|nr:hypothetical protein IFM89_015839 [Coptis chinensis]